MPLSFANPNIPIPITLTQGVAIASPIDMPVAIGATTATEYYFSDLESGLVFNRVSRELSGTPANHTVGRYYYVAVEGNDTAVQPIELRIKRNPAEYLEPDLHNCKFWKYPINYEDIRRNRIGVANASVEATGIGDNDFDTFESSLSYRILIAGEIAVSISGTTETAIFVQGSDRENFSHIFIKSRNVDTVTMAFMGR